MAVAEAFSKAAGKELGPQLLIDGRPFGEKLARVEHPRLNEELRVMEAASLHFSSVGYQVFFIDAMRKRPPIDQWKIGDAILPRTMIQMERDNAVKLHALQ